VRTGRGENTDEGRAEEPVSWSQGAGMGGNGLLCTVIILTLQVSNSGLTLETLLFLFLFFWHSTGA
jgi:hypothetical protein